MVRNIPHFSVIIPSYNEAGRIGLCLESLQANRQGALEFDLVVVDNGSTDGTVAIARRHGAEVIENREGRRRSISALRNVGASSTRGDILAFLDSDMVVPPDWLERACKYFSEGFEGVLAFPISAPPTVGWVGRIWGDHADSGRSGLAYVDFLSGHNLLINRAVFEKIGGFDEHLRTAEDRDLVLRVLAAQSKAALAPSAGLIHLGYEKGLMEFIRKEFWRQQSTLRLARKHRYSSRTLRNPVFSAGHLLCLLAVLLSLAIHSAGLLALATTCWLLPSVLILLKKYDFSRLADAPGFFFLTWLRWNVAGFALVSQLVRGEPFRGE